MHELSVCMQLVRQVESLAGEHGAIGVERLVVQIGPLSGIEPELLERAYPLAVSGTMAAGAELVLERLPIRVRCTACSVESEATMSNLACPACGEWRTELVSGRELILKTVEFRVEEENHV